MLLLIRKLVRLLVLYSLRKESWRDLLLKSHIFLLPIIRKLARLLVLYVVNVVSKDLKSDYLIIERRLTT
jgi:hypothetical protein